MASSRGEIRKPAQLRLLSSCTLEHRLYRQAGSRRANIAPHRSAAVSRPIYPSCAIGAPCASARRAATAPPASVERMGAVLAVVGLALEVTVRALV